MADPSTAWWRRRSTLFVLAFAVQLALAPFFVHPWDGFVFTEAATDLAAGVTPYERIEEDPWYAYIEWPWPALNHWYAYPPLPLLAFTPLVAAADALDAPPAVVRLALKVPFILGALALAFVGGLLARDLGNGDEATRHARRVWTERLLLFNPLIIGFSAVWGMFDAGMMALLLGSAWLLTRERYAWAGAAYAGAALCKAFPWFVGPLFLYYAWHRGPTAAKRFLLAGVAAAVVVAGPFIVSAPRGFWLQVVGMHAERGAQGFAIVTAPVQVRYLNEAFGWSLPVASPAAVAAAATALLLVVTVLVAALARRAKEPRGLLALSLATLTSLLLVNKVVNPQYLIMPVAILAVLATVDGDADMRRAMRRFSWGGLVGAATIGFVAFRSVPLDVSAWSGWPRPDDALRALAVALDAPVTNVRIAFHALGIAALLPALVSAVRIAWPAWRDGSLALRSRVRGVLARYVRSGVARPLAVAAVALLLAAPPVMGAVLATPAHATAPTVEVPRDGVVAVWLDVSWHNPSHDPSRRDGPWRDVPAVPAIGFYDTNVAKLRRDMAEIATRADVAVIATSQWAYLPTSTAILAAEEAGLAAAPLVDARALPDCPGAAHVPPSTWPADGAAVAAADAVLLGRCVAAAVAPFLAAPNAWRVDDRVVVVVRHASAEPWFATAVRSHASNAFVLASAVPGAAAPEWSDAWFVDAPVAGAAGATLTAFATATQDAVAAQRVSAALVTPTSVVWPAAVGERVTWDETAAAAAGATVRFVPWNLYADEAHVEAAATGDWRAVFRALA